MVGERPSEDPARGHESQTVYSVANIITILRLILIPFFFAVILSDRPNRDVLAFVIFAAAASTDFLDGMIARRTGTVTPVGKVIDPLVDRLLIASGVVGLFMIGRLHIALVLVLVARDVYLLYGAWVLERRHLRMPVTLVGKATTAVLLTGFSGLMLGWPVLPEGLGPASGKTVGEIIIYAGLLLSLTTAAHYTILARRMVAEADAQPADRRLLTDEEGLNE